MKTICTQLSTLFKLKGKKNDKTKLKTSRWMRLLNEGNEQTEAKTCPTTAKYWNLLWQIGYGILQELWHTFEREYVPSRPVAFSIKFTPSALWFQSTIVARATLSTARTRTHRAHREQWVGRNFTIHGIDSAYSKAWASRNDTFVRVCVLRFRFFIRLAFDFCSISFRISALLFHRTNTKHTHNLKSLMFSEDINKGWLSILRKNNKETHLLMSYRAVEDTNMYYIWLWITQFSVSVWLYPTWVRTLIGRRVWVVMTIPTERPTNRPTENGDEDDGDDVTHKNVSNDCLWRCRSLNPQGF